MALPYSRKYCARECNAFSWLRIGSSGERNGVSGSLKGGRYYNHLLKKDSAPSWSCMAVVLLSDNTWAAAW
jgi:hypothetical protein